MAQPRPFLTASWLDLVMVNFEVAPAVLERFVPRGTLLDSWRGKTFASVVGFRFLNTRMRGLRIPCHGEFPEVNLRFYVRREADDGLRRGVVFIKEIVPRPAVTLVARRVYHENYVTLPMQTERAIAPERLSYSWNHRGAWHRLSAAPVGKASLPAPESEEEFITEHYWGYSATPGGSCIEYRVEHPPWRVRRAEQAELNCDIAALYGPGFAQPLSAKPSSAFVAAGSPVIVRRGVPLPAEAAKLIAHS